MTFKELIAQCNDLQIKCDHEKSKLRIAYASEHNPVKVGDMVTDHYHTIRVENMAVYDYPLPQMKYTGIEMTKQGEPKKRQPIPRNPVFQENVRIINGQGYKFNKEGD